MPYAFKAILEVKTYLTETLTYTSNLLLCLLITEVIGQLQYRLFTILTLGLITK